MMKKIMILLFLCAAVALSAQSLSTLKGTITDKGGETVIGANVVLFQKKVKKATTSTDIDGHYSVNIDGGVYDIEISYLALKTQQIQAVTLVPGQVVKLNVTMQNDDKHKNEYRGCGGYKIPLIRQDNTTSGMIFTAEQIGRSPR
jgi:uncharacterized membrane protein